MKTTFILTGINGSTAEQGLTTYVERVQSLLDHSSDIILLTNDQWPDIDHSVEIRGDPVSFVKRMLTDTERYLYFFDFITADTFRMILDTAGSENSRSEGKAAKHPEDAEEEFYKAAYSYGMDPSNRTKFDKMMHLAEIRRKLDRYDAGKLMRRIKGSEERFPGETQCLRDRVIQESMLNNSLNSQFLDYLQARTTAFEHRCRTSEERRESRMVIDKVVGFSWYLQFNRGYYCDAVLRMLKEGEKEKAGMLVEEGLAAKFDDSEDDRRIVWKLHYCRMLLEDDTDRAAEEADLLRSYPEEIRKMIWNSDMNSCAVLSGEIYYRTAQYAKAEEAICIQYEMISDCMTSGNDPVDLPMGLDEQFRALLLKAELLKKEDRDSVTLFGAYLKCYEMIRYIDDCIGKYGFKIDTGITAGDKEYVLQNMEKNRPEDLRMTEEQVGTGSEESHFAAMYREEQ